MAHKKAGGTAKNLTDSAPKYLGVKLFAGQEAGKGAVIVRQRGTKMIPGLNVGLGKDHTLFALASGKIRFRSVRTRHFDGSTSRKHAVDVL